MAQSPLKIKLKLGSGTPEASPRSSSSRMAEDQQQMISDDDQEEEELDQEGQEDEGNMEEEGRSRSRHSHNEDGGREKHKKSKKKKKKKEKEKEKERHKHRHRDKEADEDEPPSKMSRKSHMDGVVGVPTSIPKPNKDSGPALQSLLEHLCQMLEKKDPQQFFAYPVSDNIAPGYSSIIKRPMDFATIRDKIENNEYRSVPEFIGDFRLMCNNCMKYNGPDTIYYKAAKKLLHIGEKMVTNDKIALIKKETPSYDILSKEQLGFGSNPGVTLSSYVEMDEEEEGESQDGFQVDNDTKQENSGQYEVLGDDMSSEEILDQAQDAAAAARAKLSIKKPTSALGFLRQHGDGTTSLNFLTGCEGNDPALKEKPVTLGLLTGKLTQGTTTLYNYREDKRNMAKPVKPLYYGSFSSFCPSYDSTFANLSKEESEMVYATYGNETHVQYAESIMEYSKDCDMAMHLVDQLLNLLTHQQHSRTKAVIQERRRLQEEEERITSMLIPPASESSTQVASQEQKPNDDIDFKSLKTLTELGIDTSFLSAFETKAKHSANVDKQLSQNANMLESLAREQYQRLSKPPPNNLNNLPQPTSTEVQLAEKVTDGLRGLAKQVTPGSLAPVPLVRRAMGITCANVSNMQKD